MLAVVYHVIATQDHTRQSHALLLLAMALSLGITVFQQLGIVGMLTHDLPEPMGTLFRLLRLLSFDMEILNFSCVASASPVARYAIKVIVLAVCLAYLFLIHCVNVVVGHTIVEP